MKPDLSPEMLRAFLTMQIAHAGNLAAAFPPARRREDVARRNAEKGMRAEIAARAGLSRKVVDAALMKRPVMAEHARRLWLALGVDPAAILPPEGEEGP